MQGKMENNCQEVKKKKKMKILCLHGFRTSGSFFQKQISRWDSSIFSNFDLVFPDGLFPASGKSDIESIFPPPYFEWFQFNEDFTEHKNLDVCISYLCDYITTNGPFDGLLGFSQGAALSALLIGYQFQGIILKDHPPMKLFVSISGSKFSDKEICEVAYKDQFKMKSVHFVGAKDYLRNNSEELASAFDGSLVIRHSQGHTVPKLEKADADSMREYISSISDVGMSENSHGNPGNSTSVVNESINPDGQLHLENMKTLMEAYV